MTLYVSWGRSVCSFDDGDLREHVTRWAQVRGLPAPAGIKRLHNPQGIFSSCANLFLFQTKDAADRDMVLPHLGKSEKGMVNTEYKRYLARIPKTYAIVKLGYSADVYDIEPVLIQPAFIQCVEPSDEDIVRVLRAGEVG